MPQTTPETKIPPAETPALPPAFGRGDWTQLSGIPYFVRKSGEVLHAVGRDDVQPLLLA